MTFTKEDLFWARVLRGIGWKAKPKKSKARVSQARKRAKRKERRSSRRRNRG